MKRTIAILALTLLALAACAREQTPTDASAGAALEEKTYELHGTILSRDPATNQVKVDHEEIPGYMAAMTMDYEVRGQNVADLPPDGTEIHATVHATEEAYWLTDVQAAEVPAAPTDTTMTAAPTTTTDTAGTSTGS